MVAESGNFYAVLLSCFYDCSSGWTADFFPVNGQGDGFQGKDSYIVFLLRVSRCGLHVLNQNNLHFYLVPASAATERSRWRAG
jgi:hypothetical protein